MNRGLRIAAIVAYPAYAFLVWAVLMSLDVPGRIDPLRPRPRRFAYELNEQFRAAETYSIPLTIRRKGGDETGDILALKKVPSLSGLDRKAYFRDPAFREESVVWRPDGRYERDYIFSVKLPLARVLLLGDSYMVVGDYRTLPYVLNEEYAIPTTRRTYVTEAGLMETVHGLLSDMPAGALKGKAVVLAISEGSSVEVSPQYNGMPVPRTFATFVGRVAYKVASSLRVDGWFREPAPSAAPVPRPAAHPLDTCTTVTGKEIKADPSHINPVLFRYLGRDYALGFYDRNIAFVTWDGPFFDSMTESWSLENWLRRIRTVAERKGGRLAVLFIPTKLSAYWPVIGPLLDYDKLYAYASTHKKFNRTIRSGGELRSAMPRSIESWRTFLRGVCARDGIGFIDLTGPFREATAKGNVVYLDFDTHWNDRGVHIAAEQVARYLEEGRSR